VIDINFMVGREAGLGVQSVGFILAKTFAWGGRHIFADQGYESRIRSGHNVFRVRVKDVSNNDNLFTGPLDRLAEAAGANEADWVKGESIIIFLRLKDGVSPSSDSKKELATYMRTMVGPIATPDEIYFVGWQAAQDKE
jgi:hypothetical protein